MNTLREAYAALVAIIDQDGDNGIFGECTQTASSYGMTLEDMSDGSAMEQVYTLEEGDGVLRLGYFMPPAEEGEATFHQFDLDLTVAGEVVATRHWDQECKFIHRDAAMLSDDALPW